MKYIAIIFVFFYVSISFASEVNIQVKVKGLETKTIYLLSYYGHNQSIVDSARVKNKSDFQFQIKDAKTGMYRVILGKTSIENKQNLRSFNIIIEANLNSNKDNTISLSTNFENPEDSMVVLKSAVNKKYFDYLHLKKENRKKLDILENVLRFYPNDDKFYRSIQKQYNQIQKKSNYYTHSLIKKSPTSFFAKVVQLETLPFLEASLKEEDRFQFLKNNYFKISDFQDTILLYSNAFSNKIISYYGLFRDNRYSEEEQGKEFIKAVNPLLHLAKKGDLKVFDYVLSYSLEGFNQIKQDAVLAYISDNFKVENSCGIEDEKLKSILQKSADYKRTAIGAIAPEIELMDGRKLSEINSKHVLILFWASWCAHCTNTLPEILEYYHATNKNNLEIIAVSIDKDKVEFNKAIEKNKYDWINHCEYKGWESPSASKYNVHATPSMFLLDERKTIIAKPESLGRLKMLIEE